MITQLTMLQQTKVFGVSVLVFLYCASFIVLLVGFFTPGLVAGSTSIIHIDYGLITCSSYGFVVGDCTYPFYGAPDSSRDVLLKGFYISLAGSLMFLTTTLLMAGAILSNLHKSKIYMAGLAISLGVLLPAGGILIVCSTIYMEVSVYAGYSCILMNVAGGLMILFYISLRIYDYCYSEGLRRKAGNRKLQSISPYSSPPGTGKALPGQIRLLLTKANILTSNRHT